MFNKRIILIVLTIVVLYLLKPSVLFKPNGKLRHYGIGYDKDGFKKTFFTLPIVIVVLVLLINEYF